MMYNRDSMPKDFGSRIFLGLLALLTLGLFAGLGLYGPWLKKELVAGHEAALAGRGGSNKPARPFSDDLSGISAEHPESISVQLSGLGILFKKDSDAMKAALVCPLIAETSMAPSEILTGVHSVWSLGLKESGDTLTLSNIHDEGGVVHAAIESGKGIEALMGQLRVRRMPRGYRLEAFWTSKDDYDRERAQLDGLVKSVKLAPPKPLKVQVEKEHQAAVPPGWQMSEDPGGIEVKLTADPRVVFGLATGTGHAGLAKSESLIDQYLTKSVGLTDPTTGLVRAYPTVDSPTGQTWDITARDLEYSVGGNRVRAVITAALTHGRLGQAFLLAVRQAPSERWAEVSYALNVIESTARFFPKGPDADALAIPIQHPEGTWELFEGWAVGRAMRVQGKPRWREAALPDLIRTNRTGGRWAMNPLLAQPDGNFGDPDDPRSTLK